MPESFQSTKGQRPRFIPHIASRWTFIKIRQVFSPYAVPWDCGFVIPWLFSPSNCYFPFQTRSHKMASGGGLSASSTLSRSHIASHHVASHRKASHAAQLLSSSQTSRGSCTDPQYKARATTAKNHARAHAARSCYPLAHPRPHPAPRNPCPPSSARPNHHWSRIKRPPAARRGCRSTRRPSRLLSGLAAPRLPSDLSFDAHPSRSGRA